MRLSAALLGDGRHDKRLYRDVSSFERSARAQKRSHAVPAGDSIDILHRQRKRISSVFRLYVRDPDTGRGRADLSFRLLSREKADGGRFRTCVSVCRGVDVHGRSVHRRDYGQAQSARLCGVSGIVSVCGVCADKELLLRKAEKAVRRVCRQVVRFSRSAYSFAAACLLYQGMDGRASGRRGPSRLGHKQHRGERASRHGSDNDVCGGVEEKRSTFVAVRGSVRGPVRGDSRHRFARRDNIRRDIVRDPVGRDDRKNAV